MVGSRSTSTASRSIAGRIHRPARNRRRTFGTLWSTSPRLLAASSWRPSERRSLPRATERVRTALPDAWNESVAYALPVIGVPGELARQRTLLQDRAGG